MPSRFAESSASDSECSLEHLDGSPTPTTRSGPSASTASAATSAESMPPDMPSTTEGMPFLSMKSRRPSTSARQTSSRSLSGSATVPGSGSNGATGASHTRHRVTVIGPIPPARRSRGPAPAPPPPPPPVADRGDVQRQVDGQQVLHELRGPGQQLPVGTDHE